ncbi:Protein of unknown function (DUF2946) [Mucilaginibacter yixingensis]|uniref:DUF2946 domain-containing protein n=1 Tax=Mucilaginibacter yixingensis TaxID=1295612 RepID=A0A2T5JCG1_9SPHI|nr:DUF2946 family protein [Mucilaginibacter yixingensis]PTQ99451.1 Protein of unknown function (DUF2946) [Mucilaginibacter yixingensis]
MFLLLCFAIGQAIVITHAHNRTEQSSKPSKSGSQEDNCKICQLSHAFTAIVSLQHFSFTIQSSHYTYAVVAQAQYHRILMLFAFDRGPPVV